MKNLLSNLVEQLPNELIEPLLDHPHARIERIVSTGQSSPPGFWYDQEEDEWVVVLQGSARLSIDGKDRALHMEAGDSLFLPAHQKHRVEWTSPSEPTVWLAVFLKSESCRDGRCDSLSADVE